MSETIRVMVVDDHPMWRDAVERALPGRAWALPAGSLAGPAFFCTMVAAKKKAASTCAHLHIAAPCRWRPTSTLLSIYMRGVDARCSSAPGTTIRPFA